MINFSVFNPTRVHFGRKVAHQIGSDAKLFGNKALILIGKGSVKKNGILHDVCSALDNAGIEWCLFEGIKSNPVYEDADNAVHLSKSFGADMIIAVGGGSVIDTAKSVAVGHFVNHSVWEFFKGNGILPQRALPLFVVLTLAATGTEMNRFTVLQDTLNRNKRGWGHELLYPKVAYLDPTYTYSVPSDYTAYGVSDMLAHTFELYFGVDNAPLSDHFATDVVKLGFEYGPLAVQQANHYEARANILWLSTVALNGTLQSGKKTGDFGVHAFEHVLSVLYDIPHGAGLSVVYPAWMKHFYNKIEDKLNFMANRVLGNEKTGIDFIAELEYFYSLIGTPKRLSEIGIHSEKHQEILEALVQNQVRGAYFDMNLDDYKALLKLMA